MVTSDHFFFAQSLDRLLKNGGIGSVLQPESTVGVSKPGELHATEDAPRLTVCLRGTAKYEMTSGGKTHRWTLRKHEAIFIPPNRWLRICATTNYESLGIVFLHDVTRFLLARCNQEIRRHPSYPFNLNRRVLLWPQLLDEEGAYCMRMISQVHSRRHSALLERSLMNLLLDLALRALEKTPTARQGKGHATWMAACAFIQEHLHLPISRKEVARELRLHPNHVSRLFTEYSSKSFAQYVTDLRFDRAKVLLRDSQYNIAEIASQCGFSSPSYFSTTWLKEFGQTPTATRLAYLRSTGFAA